MNRLSPHVASTFTLTATTFTGARNLFSVSAGSSAIETAANSEAKLRRTVLFMLRTFPNRFRGVKLRSYRKMTTIPNGLVRPTMANQPKFQFSEDGVKHPVETIGIVVLGCAFLPLRTHVPFAVPS